MNLPGRDDVATWGQPYSFDKGPTTQVHECYEALVPGESTNPVTPLSK